MYLIDNTKAVCDKNGLVKNRGGTPMRKNDDLKNKKSGCGLTRRTMLKATLGLGALASTGAFVAYASGSGAPSNSPSGGHAGKKANWYNGFMFQDESLVFEFIRVMAKSVEHGADIGESLATAYRIKQKEGDQQALLQAWYEEWRKLGERIEKIGDECLEKGHHVSARDAYFRASEYYRSADF